MNEHKCYIIAYDLRTPGRNYEALYEAIKSYGTWGRLTESVWAVVSSKDSVEIRNHLMNMIDENDRLMVVRCGKEAAWTNMIANNEWIQKAFMF